MAQTPRYRCLQDTFIQPFMYYKGSIIESDVSPGNHLQPLNAAAKARMDEWYAEEYDEVNDKTGEKTGRKIQPHMKFKQVQYTKSPLAKARLVQAPKKDDMTGALNIASVGLRGGDTDQRPGADEIYSEPDFIDEGEDLTEEELVAEQNEGSITPVFAAPRPSIAEKMKESK